MDLPDELTPAEVELREIYAELRELKEEAEKKKNADKTASRNRGVDVVAEDAAEVVKKLKSSGLLEKLRIEDAPKTQYKRASNLERRLHTKPEPSSPAAEDSSRGAPSFRPPPPPRPAQTSPKIRQNFTPERQIVRPQTALKDPPQPQFKPKNMFAAFLDSSDSSNAGPPSAPSYGPQSGNSQSPNYSYSSSDEKRTSPSRAPSFGYQSNGYRQKMVFLEADNVEETFLRPIFETFGPLLRITSVPEKKQAFILFKIWEHSQKAIRELHGKCIEGVLFNVTVGDNKNEPKNRSGSNNWSPQSGGLPVPPPQAKPETRQLAFYEDGELV